MSVQDAEMSGQSDMSKVFEDRSFVTSILNSVSHLLENELHVIMNLASVVYNAPPSLIFQLPGVDPNDPSVKDLLASLHGQGEVTSSCCFFVSSFC
jgi:26S proteasome regulatory subunit N10